MSCLITQKNFLQCRAISPVCVCSDWTAVYHCNPLRWQVRRGFKVCVHSSLRMYYTASLSLWHFPITVLLSRPTLPPPAFLLYEHGDFIFVVYYPLSRGRGPATSTTTTAAAAEERQSWARGLSRRWSQGGRGEGSHSGPDLAVRSQLTTLVLCERRQHTAFISFENSMLLKMSFKQRKSCGSFDWITVWVLTRWETRKESEIQKRKRGRLWRRCNKREIKN